LNKTSLININAKLELLVLVSKLTVFSQELFVYLFIYSFPNWEVIKGILGAKKYPVKLAKKSEIKCPNPCK